MPDFEKFITIYKINYFEQMEYSKVYDGVEETLASLKDRNIKVSLLTTKIQDQADRIIDHFNLRKYFDLVMGRRDGIAHKPSPEPLLKICDDLAVDVKNTLMVGDTELDIQCGKNAGSYTCGVLYGYRTKELLEIEKPDFIIEGYQRNFRSSLIKSPPLPKGEIKRGFNLSNCYFFFSINILNKI